MITAVLGHQPHFTPRNLARQEKAALLHQVPYHLSLYSVFLTERPPLLLREQERDEYLTLMQDGRWDFLFPASLRINILGISSWVRGHSLQDQSNCEDGGAVLGTPTDFLLLP